MSFENWNTQDKGACLQRKKATYHPPGIPDQWAFRPLHTQGTFTSSTASSRPRTTCRTALCGGTVPVPSCAYRSPSGFLRCAGSRCKLFLGGCVRHAVTLLPLCGTYLDGEGGELTTDATYVVAPAALAAANVCFAVTFESQSLTEEKRSWSIWQPPMLPLWNFNTVPRLTRVAPHFKVMFAVANLTLEECGDFRPTCSSTSR